MPAATIETVRVHGHGHTRHRLQIAKRGGQANSQALRPSYRSGVEQDASRQIKCLLCPAHDHDLFGFAANTTRSSDISGDRFAQCGNPIASPYCSAFTRMRRE